MVTYKPYMMSAGGNPGEHTCYVCGKEGSASSRALMESEKDAQEAKAMFDKLGLHADLVDNQGTPDLQVGSCDKHSRNQLKLMPINREGKRELTLVKILESLR